MIRYTLKCRDGHAFESWFQSAERYGELRTAGHVSCPECGTAEVEKSLMAPQVQASRKRAAAAPEDSPDAAMPEDPRARALAELRAKVEAESDYVGMNFAAEARAIHEGEAPRRSIYGEAKFADAKALVEDGVPVAPLPFIPKSKSH